MESLSEQHPREQGLKPDWLDRTFGGGTLSEQHPREQGLKLQYNTGPRELLVAFQSNIQENKD